MQSAHRFGFETAWVSGEAVCKMRAIETNDSSKTDIKDPHVIHTLAMYWQDLDLPSVRRTLFSLRE